MRLPLCLGALWATNEAWSAKVDITISCHTDGTPNWDLMGMCDADNVVGGSDEFPCGTGLHDLCHVAVAYGVGQGTGEHCGKCMKVTVGPKTVFAKSIGVEEVVPFAFYNLRVNRGLFEDFGGSGGCGQPGNVLSGSYEFVSCLSEVTCWPDDETEWDPEYNCGGSVPGDPGEQCGTAEDPCKVTVSYDPMPPPNTVCGECVTFTTENGTELVGRIVGAEASDHFWNFRMNELAYAALGGSGACGALHQVVAVANFSQARCPIYEHVSCFSDSTGDWDTANECDTSNIAGSDEACGDSLADPCHVVVTYETSAPGDGGECGKCVEVSYDGGKIVYGKIIGAEVEANLPWKYRFNTATYTKFGGAGPCGDSNAVAAVEHVKEVPCLPELTCWANSTAEWDPASTCGGSVVGGEVACGTPESPCDLTGSFDLDPVTCNECVTMSYDGGKQLIGKIIGGEETTRWSFRVNELAFVSVGGVETDCGALQKTVAVESVLLGPCPRLTVPISCFDDDTSDWDVVNECSDGDLQGAETACGDSLADPCHVVPVYDAAPGTGDGCGNCMEIEFDSGTKKYAKVIGAEVQTPPHQYEFRVNKLLFTALGGTGTCGVATGAAEVDVVRPVECLQEVTCWPDEEDDWDPNETCGGTAEGDPGVVCGAEEAPCAVTKGFAALPDPGTDCDTCVTITYDGGKELHGYVVGTEETTRWTYRVNELAYQLLTGGGECGAFHEVIAVESVAEAPCPVTTIPFTCFENSTSDWDPADECSTSDWKGSEDSCGGSLLNPCHVVSTYETGEAPGTGDSCGGCLEIEFSGQKKYGKLIGAEEQASPAWQFRVSEFAYGLMGGTGTCGANVVHVKVVRSVPCATEVSCWDDTESDWDPDSNCGGSVGGDPGVDCGSAETPCKVTKAYDFLPNPGTDCGECIELTFGLGQVIWGEIVGGEVQTKWEYRVNGVAYDKIGGKGGCGDFHDVVGIEGSEEGKCPVEDGPSTSDVPLPTTEGDG
eukprot:Polyplicarium_translucidae@DN2683_c1_g1_i1.p1